MLQLKGVKLISKYSNAANGIVPDDVSCKPWVCVTLCNWVVKVNKYGNKGSLL